MTCIANRQDPTGHEYLGGHKLWWLLMHTGNDSMIAVLVILGNYFSFDEVHL